MWLCNVVAIFSYAKLLMVTCLRPKSCLIFATPALVAYNNKKSAVMGHEKEVAGARNILSKSFPHSKPKNIRILGTFCYVLYKQPTTNIFH